MKKLLLIFFFSYFQAAYSQTPQHVYSEALNFFKDGNYIESISFAKKARSHLKTTNPKIEALLAQAYFENGEVVEAKIVYEKLLALTPASKQSADSFKPFIALGERIDKALETG